MRLEKITIKIGMLFGKLPLSPNQWTYLSIIPAILAVFLIADQQVLWGIALFGLAALLDVVDGAVAKVLGQRTKLGTYLDLIFDRYTEFFMILGLFFVSLPEFLIPSALWLLLFLFGSMISAYVRSASVEKRLIEQAGTLFGHALRLIGLFLIFGLVYFDKFYAVYLLTAMAVISNILAIQHIWTCRKAKVGADLL